MRFQQKFYIFTLSAALFSLALTGNSFAEKKQQQSGPPPGMVSIITIEPQTIQHTQELPGRLTAFKTAEIRPQVTGIITERLFSEGGSVKKGQQLYQIDPAPYQAVYDAAVADLKSAKANLAAVMPQEQRYRELVKANAVSKQDYDNAKAALLEAEASIAVAKAAIAQAQINLNYTKVYAPISGRIGSSAVTEGALVTANQETMLAQITQLDPIYIDMQESRKQLIKTQKRSKDLETIEVELVLDKDIPQYEHKGTLEFSEVLVNPSTSSVQLRALFPNPDHFLYPGLFVRARLFLDKAEVILIPQKAALQGTLGKVTVWTLDEKNIVNQVSVTLGSSYKNQWIVTDGLKKGDRVITAGFQKARPGSPAMVTPDGPPPSQNSENK